MSVDKLRTDIRKVIKTKILEVSSFLLYVKENISNDNLSQDDIRNLSLAYHRLWWFRENLLKKYPAYKDFPKLKPVPDKKYLKAAKLDLEILISRNPKLADSMSVSKIFEEDMSNAAALISKKNTTNTNGSKPILFLETDGRLCLGGNNCYPMSKKDRRYKLVKFLADNKGPHSTKYLTDKFKFTSVKAAGNDISRLNGLLTGSIGLEKVIDNIKPDGYFINNDYSIVVKKK